MRVELEFHFGEKPTVSGSYLVLHTWDDSKVYMLDTCQYSAKWERWNAYDGSTPEYAFSDNEIVAWARLLDAERLVNYEYTKRKYELVSKDTGNNQ